MTKVRGEGLGVDRLIVTSTPPATGLPVKVWSDVDVSRLTEVEEVVPEVRLMFLRAPEERSCTDTDPEVVISFERTTLRTAEKLMGVAGTTG